MTLSSGHPFPRVPHLALSLAIVVRDARPGPAHFAQVELAPELPRFVPVPGTRHVITIEEIVRANLDALYPDAQVEQAYLFRLTRAGELTLREPKTGSLIRAVEEAAKRRPRNAAVRVEVERAMPGVLRELLMTELQRELQRERERDLRRSTSMMLTAAGEPIATAATTAATEALTRVALYEVDGLLDLTGLRELNPDLPGLRYPALRGRAPLPADRSIWETLRAGDVLV